ncbi:cilia- and flagella-associated protein 206 isoform X2 [Halyomorpha halys]|nr:cilia- and flagella-associated protein 206-like isoform X2 [Halyomorpha halys]
MLYLEENTLFMKNVVAGISSECFLKGVDVSPKGVELVITNTLLNPELNFSYNASTRKEELTRLADTCVETLCGSDLGLRKLYKLQEVFHKEYSSDERIVKEYESLKRMYIEPLIKKIITSEPIEKDKICDVFKLIVTYTMLMSGMGDPRVIEMFQECEEALGSIFSFTDLTNMFMSETSEKRKILLEVAKVTAGILLYNKIKNRGGMGIENYPCILGDSLDSLASILLIHVQHAQEAAQSATKLVTDRIYWCGTKEGCETLVFDKPAKLSDEEFTYAFWMSLIQQQVVSYMRRLYFNVRHYADLIETWQEEFLQCAQKIDEAVSFRIAVPTKVIYPLFMELHDKWKIFYMGIVIVSVYEKVLSYISEFLIFDDIPENVSDMLIKIEKRANLFEDWFKAQEKCNMSNDEFRKLLTRIKITKLDQDLERAEPYESDDEEIVELIDSEKVNCEVVYPRKKEINNYNIMFAGFDPVYLIKSNGVIVDIAAEIGLLVYDNRYFGFRDIKSAYRFGDNPDKYITKVINFARRHPHYIDILQLRDFMDKFRGKEAFPERSCTSKPIEDKEIQTEIHPIPSYIDKNYIHSIWQARANYCLMTTISTKRTKSVQTRLSYMKTSIPIQTFPLKNREQQTMKDNWVNTSMPLVFRYGLRGQKNPDYHEVSLTMPLEEPHQRIIIPTLTYPKKEVSAQTEQYSYFDTCLKVKIEPHPLMFYT